MHQLFADDCDRRMEFTENFLGWSDDWQQLFQNILWSDEAVFYIGGFMKWHNCHYWGADNPDHCVEKAQGHPKVWCVITSTVTCPVVGHFILWGHNECCIIPQNVMRSHVAGHLSVGKHHNTSFHTRWGTPSF
jgi:hypothetical protein